jgi:hypothetical protein
MDDLLIPLSNGWVCEKRRDGSAPGGYLTTYWSPEVSATSFEHKIRTIEDADENILKQVFDFSSR